MTQQLQVIIRYYGQRELTYINSHRWQLMIGLMLLISNNFIGISPKISDSKCVSLYYQASSSNCLSI